MIFRCVNTGSSGNSYAIMGNDESLLIEAGMSFKKVTKALEYRVQGIKGCIVSHAHGDHAKYIEEYRSMGISVYFPADSGQKTARLGGFNIQAFDVPHDCPNKGFLITHDGFGRMLFITDAEYVQYNFANLNPPVNHIVVECNYQDEYVSEDEKKKNRVLRTHMGYNTMRDFVLANMNGGLKTVTLIHYSDTNCDIKKAVRDLQKEVGVDVVVSEARSGGYSFKL